MVYGLLGVAAVVCILLLCTLMKTKKSGPAPKREPVRNASLRDVEITETAPASVPVPVPEPMVRKAGSEPEPVPAVQEETSVNTECPVSEIAFAEKFLLKSFMDNALRDEFLRYKGSFVNWRGKLRVAYSFQSDFIFGNRPGTRATFHLCEIADQYGMRSTVTCVAAFDPDAAETLKSMTGKEIAFRAKLVSVNSTIREIVLDEATLV